MNIDKIVEKLKEDNSSNRVIRTEFVEFMESLSRQHTGADGQSGTLGVSIAAVDTGQLMKNEFTASDVRKDANGARKTGKMSGQIRDLPDGGKIDLRHANIPYLVLICCILSLRTNDKTTYPSSMRMLELAKTPCEMAKVDEEKLAQAIYPVGFYKNKARQIKKLSKILCEEMDSKVPDSIEELIKFDGVGRKTANLVLTKGFGIPAICVDVHVHRICNRLGYVNTKTPEETEFALRKKLPKKYWIDFNTLLVTHGQNICKPGKPLCEKCSISKYCGYFKVL